MNTIMGTKNTNLQDQITSKCTLECLVVWSMHIMLIIFIFFILLVYVCMPAYLLGEFLKKFEDLFKNK